MNNKIIDCFTFYNELALLEFRLEYLYNYVDYFVLVEARYTHAGNPKELYYDNNKDCFNKYNDKIIHIIVDEFPIAEKSNDYWNSEYWVRERFQRNEIDKGIYKIDKLNKLDYNDIIIISDLDEIPDRERLKEIKYCKLYDNTRYVLCQDMYYYNINCKLNETWTHGKFVNYSTYINTFYRKPQEIRLSDSVYKEIKVEKGGWHFSYFGNLNFIVNKIKNFAHQEYNNNDFINLNKFRTAIDNNVSIYSNNESKGVFIDIKDNDYLPENHELLIKFQKSNIKI
jgi:beta-1,4-mannosyl-glycoprotein beta-1,4-N-acetylglucosaminyltransferase